MLRGDNHCMPLVNALSRTCPDGVLLLDLKAINLSSWQQWTDIIVSNHVSITCIICMSLSREAGRLFCILLLQVYCDTW